MLDWILKIIIDFSKMLWHIKNYLPPDVIEPFSLIILCEINIELT